MNKELEKCLKEVEKELFEMNFQKKELKEANMTNYTVGIPSYEKERHYLFSMTIDHDKEAVVFNVTGKSITGQPSNIRLAAFNETILEKKDSVISYIKRAYDLLKV